MGSLAQLVEQLTASASAPRVHADMGALPSPTLTNRFGVRVPGDPAKEDWPSQVWHPSRKRWSARERRAGSNPASSALSTQVASSTAKSSRLLLGGFGVRVPGDLRPLAYPARLPRKLAGYIRSPVV